MKKKHFNIPIFIPELACPFQCIYCNQCTISGVGSLPDDHTIIDTIEAYLGTMDKDSEIQLAYFGGNFTGLSLKDQAHYLKLVAPYISSGMISGIRLSTRPDYITDESLKLLKDYQVESIELGAQSLDNQVLKASGRGHTAEDTRLASKKIIRHGFSLGLQMMIGLPGDTLSKSIKTAEEIIDLGAEDTRIYPTLVIKNTVLEAMYQKKQYYPLELADAVNWTKEILLLFEKSRVRVLKVGLHPSEGLTEGDELVAGPFHRSLRELVESAIWMDRFGELLNQSGDLVKISVPASQINAAIGYSASNKKRLAENYREVKFIPSRDLHGREFRFNITSS